MIHTAFFGEADKTFCLTRPMILELERQTKTGIGSLCRRLFDGQFSLDELRQVVRLGLIGGGTSPDEAERLAAIYADNRPLAEVFPLAVSILEAAYFGEALLSEQGNPDSHREADRHQGTNQNE